MATKKIDLAHTSFKIGWKRSKDKLTHTMLLIADGELFEIGEISKLKDGSGYYGFFHLPYEITLEQPTGELSVICTAKSKTLSGTKELLDIMFEDYYLPSEYVFAKYEGGK